jgi:hypothetical protein
MTDPKETSAANRMHMTGAAALSAPILLAISSLLLCSCADFALPLDEPGSNRPRIPGSGDIDF